MDNFGDAWGWFSTEVHNLACEKGWWVLRTADGPSAGTRSFLECMGLVISELGEAVEAFRKPSCSKVILGHSHAAEELADIIIRLADLGKYFDLDISASTWMIERDEIFDVCNAGTDEDNFVCCFDAMMDEGHSSIDAGNPIERLAIVAKHLGEAITSYVDELHDADAEEAMAQAVLEICTLASQEGIDLGEAIIAKHAYNQSRTYRHGPNLY